MKIINVPRGYGKSAKLLELANETHYPIIVDTVYKKENLKAKAYSLGYKFITVYTVHELIHLRGARITKVYVDNMDDVLQAFVGYEIDTATCSIEQTPIDKLQ